MITGYQPMFPTEQYYDEKPFDIQYGITLKQYMVIEFTKAFHIANPERINKDPKDYWVTEAIELTDEVIKQLNEKP